VAGMPALQAMLFTWFDGNLLSTILRAIDRASMAHGIEVRMPSDWRLVTFAFVFTGDEAGAPTSNAQPDAGIDPAGHKEYN
jgi:hypothetical protein